MADSPRFLAFMGCDNGMAVGIYCNFTAVPKLAEQEQAGKELLVAIQVDFCGDKTEYVSKHNLDTFG